MNGGCKNCLLTSTQHYQALDQIIPFHRSQENFDKDSYSRSFWQTDGQSQAVTRPALAFDDTDKK